MKIWGLKSVTISYSTQKKFDSEKAVGGVCS